MLRLHVESFIALRRNPSFVLPGSHFVRTKFSNVVGSARLNGMKKQFDTSLQSKLKENVNKFKQIRGVKLYRLAEKKFDSPM